MRPSLVLAALLLAGAPPRAEAALRVVVQVATEADRVLVERVRGQVSDLPVALTVHDGSLAPTLAAQLAASDEIAARHGADAVVWFAHASAERLVVHVGQPATRNVLVRAVDGAPRSSPLLESAALVVRTALMALADGGQIGVSRSAALAGERAPPTRAARRLALGWMLAVDGLTPLGQQGLAGAVGLHGSRIGVEAALSSTLPTPVSDAYATLALSRATLSLGPVVRRALGAGFVASAAAHAGVAVLFRTTTPRQPGVLATPSSRRLTPVVAPELRLAWGPGPLGGLGLVLGVAADYLPGIPDLVYRREDGQPGETRRPFALQPRLSLGLELARR